MKISGGYRLRTMGAELGLWAAVAGLAVVKAVAEVALVVLAGLARCVLYLANVVTSLIAQMDHLMDPEPASADSRRPTGDVVDGQVIQVMREEVIG